jgi:signal transduction histidine kinase
LKQTTVKDDPCLAGFPAGNPNPALRMNSKGILLYANKSSRPILKFWKITVGKPVPAAIYEIIEEIFRKKTTKSVELKVNKSFYEFAFVPVKKTDYINVYGKNITEHKNTEMILIQKEGMLRALHKNTEEMLQIDKITLEKLVVAKSMELLKTHLDLERAKRLSDIGFLASTVAHELRNPLAAITMAAANIKRKAQHAKIESNLHTISKKIGESNQIINNLLFYTKLRPPKLEKTNLYTIIEECINNAEKNYQNKPKVNKYIVSLRNTLIDADPLQLQEVFSNILNNAFDSIEEKTGKIVLRARLHPDAISISVKDNGSGITADDLDKIFDPFFTTKAKGTGLGLTICSQMIKLHGGQIDIASKVNQGTTLTISLPKPL